jgi:chemotaxis signal transduction protein
MAAPMTNQAVVERAERLRAEQRAAQRKSESIALVTFRLGRDIYALPATQVTGVLAGQPLVPIPSTPDHLLGVTHFRGEILPVFDLKVMLGLTETPAAPDYLLIARPGADTAALGCDSCPDIVHVLTDDIKPPRSASGSDVDRYLQGHVLVREGVVGVLDIDKVLQC